MSRIFFSTIIIFTFIAKSCYSQFPEGKWRGELKINDTINLPFNFYLKKNKLAIINADERIVTDEMQVKGDSVIIQMPVFDSELIVKVNEKIMKGYFYNHARKDFNKIPFEAVQGVDYRFLENPAKPLKDISGRYHIYFDGEDEDAKNAVGVFSQVENRVTGTFLTTAGDYRFLEGELSGRRLWLSAFDGSHLFLFTTLVKDDSLLNGEFFSGQHWHDTWKGYRDEKAKLTSPDSLTFLKPEYEKFTFTFNDKNGNPVSSEDERFQNKPLIVQIMGTWCPNCMDETRFLSDWYNSKQEDIEIISLDYERMSDTSRIYRNIDRLIKQFEIRYPVLYAGTSNKTEAAKTLPVLNRIFAFPTTIFLNKERRVVKIYTGFNGPATGEEFEKFRKEFNATIKILQY